MLITCNACGRLFQRPGERGPLPRECGSCDSEIADLVQEVREGWELDAHHDRLLLQIAAVFYDIKTTIAHIQEHGHYYVDRFGQPQAHPGLAKLNTLRNTARLLIRELNLEPEDLETAAWDYRPPRQEEVARA